MAILARHRPGRLCPRSSAVPSWKGYKPLRFSRTEGELTTFMAANSPQLAVRLFL